MTKLSVLSCPLSGTGHSSHDLQRPRCAEDRSSDDRSGLVPIELAQARNVHACVAQRDVIDDALVVQKHTEGMTSFPHNPDQLMGRRQKSAPMDGFNRQLPRRNGEHELLDVPEPFNGFTKVGSNSGSRSGCVAPPEHRSLLPSKQHPLDGLTRRRPAPTHTEPAGLPKHVVLRVYSWMLRATVRSVLDDPAAAIDQRCRVREGKWSATQTGRIADEDRPCFIDTVEVPLREVKKVVRCGTYGLRKHAQPCRIQGRSGYCLQALRPRYALPSSDRQGAGPRNND